MPRLKPRPLAATLFALFAVPAAQAQEVVKIGMAGPLSGEIAHLGKALENGAVLAIDDLNARKLTIGGKKVTFKLQSEDDAADPKQGTAVAQKLADARVNGVVGHVTSGTTVPASRIYNQAGIPQISPSATTAVYTRQGFAGAFRVVANDAKLGGTLGRYAVGSLGAKRIAVIDDRSAYGQGVADEFVKSARTKAQIVDREFTNTKATDFSAILTKIKAKKPDLIFLGSMDAVAGPLLRQMKALGMPVKLMGGDGICTDALPRLAGDGMRDGEVICAEAGGVDASREKAVAEWTKRFHDRFHSDTQTYAPYAYDAVMTMAAAMQAAQSTQPSRYLPALKRVKHDGLTGTIAFDAAGDIKDGALTLYTYKAGARTKLEVIR
ncbi:branched-chain amino acid ABC transporter substrate-binding protein [Massilia arenosa]|uniref:Branched-chain amino acid ABC transporter substrate-binding protein n=1 Tax=Zemynaea arenosa TaxID=2561931 RepID=A0A4Y9S272_9BURK|nr:branched-chain amino acid ABC transporter substrate-binding protein [Massilia arenosa]TFW15454.1 branched-chain amino acid ABC transporter substrate-binding protein [Massilia arenosa]